MSKNLLYVPTRILHIPAGILPLPLNFLAFSIGNFGLRLTILGFRIANLYLRITFLCFRIGIYRLRLTFLCFRINYLGIISVSFIFLRWFLCISSLHMLAIIVFSPLHNIISFTIYQLFIVKYIFILLFNCFNSKIKDQLSKYKQLQLLKNRKIYVKHINR